MRNAVVGHWGGKEGLQYHDVTSYLMASFLRASFTSRLSFHLLNQFFSFQWILYPLYKRGNWVSESERDLSRISWCVCGGTRTRVEVFQVPIKYQAQSSYFWTYVWSSQQHYNIKEVLISSFLTVCTNIQLLRDSFGRAAYWLLFFLEVRFPRGYSFFPWGEKLSITIPTPLLE